MTLPAGGFRFMHMMVGAAKAGGVAALGWAAGAIPGAGCASAASGHVASRHPTRTHNRTGLREALIRIQPSS